MSQKRYRMKCNVCGLDDIIVDSWVHWSKEKQEWVADDLDALKSNEVYCYDCEDVTGFQEEEIHE